MNQLFFASKALLIYLWVALGTYASVQAQKTTALEANLERTVRLVANDRTEGRMTGSEGARQTAYFLAAMLRKYKIDPADDNGDYLLPFPYPAALQAPTEAQEWVLEAHNRKLTGILGDGFMPLSLSANGDTIAEVVFAGYGLVIPATEEQRGYDSYAELEVKGKWVLMLADYPLATDAARRQYLGQNADLRYKALLARERGALGILVVRPQRDGWNGAPLPLSKDESMGSSGILAASISYSLADSLLAAAGHRLNDLLLALDAEDNKRILQFPLPGIKCRVKININRKTQTDYNVLGGYLPRGSSRRAVLIGAHYDHLGYGEINSLATGDEQRMIHNGADDNASGVAAVLELARMLRQAKQPFVVAFWSGEEMGLLGSGQYAKQPTVPLNRIGAYLNFDMVGRLSKNTLIVQGTGSSPIWEPLVAQANRSLQDSLKLVFQADPYQPTDILSFYPQGVPVLSFFTGGHGDYHKPSDDVEKINFAGLTQITQLAFQVAQNVAMADSLPYRHVARAERLGGRRGVSIVLGVIPDYATTGNEGMPISGAKAGSPAEEAGLKPGDRIVELDGRTITNIYDYMFIMGSLRPEVEVPVVVVRGTERITLRVKPKLRQ